MDVHGWGGAADGSLPPGACHLSAAGLAPILTLARSAPSERDEQIGVWRPGEHPLAAGPEPPGAFPRPNRHPSPGSDRLHLPDCQLS